MRSLSRAVVATATPNDQSSYCNEDRLIRGGADRDRTGDPLLAKQVLSQLSYSPLVIRKYFSRRLDAVSGSRRADSKTLLISSRDCGILEWNDCWLLYASLSLPDRVQFRSFSPTPSTFSLRKEVIQPQVLLRLPCYDFTPIMNHTLGLFKLGLLVQSTFVM